VSEWNSGSAGWGGGSGNSGWSGNSGSAGSSGWGSGTAPQNSSAASSGGNWGSPRPQNNYGSGSPGGWNAPKEPEEPKPEYTISPSKFIAGLLGGGCGGILGWFLLDGLRAAGSFTPLCFALAVTAVAVCAAAAIRIAALADGSAKYFRKTEPKAHFASKCLIVFPILFLLSGLFEFLYELGGDSAVLQPTSYIFLLDTSGSMANGLGAAMESAAAGVINDMDEGFPFSVYTFDSRVENPVPMHAKTAADAQNGFKLKFSGKTMFYGVLEQVCKDYEQALSDHTWTGGGVPKVLLFSDGLPSDSDSGAIDRLRKNDLTVSTVAADGADIAVMQEIAEKTGGAALHISDTADLRTAMEQAFRASAERTLFSVRPRMVRGWLYVLMRLIFLFLLGAAFAAILYYAGSLRYDLDRAVITKIITGILSAAAIEIGTQSFGLSEFVTAIIFGVLAGFNILHNVYIKETPRKQEQYIPGTWGSGQKPQQDAERREIVDRNSGGGPW